MSYKEVTMDLQDVLEMNTNLRKAQSQLRQAHAVTDLLRRRFPAEHVARYAEPTTLLDSICTATHLKGYYGLLEAHILQATATGADGCNLSEERIAHIIRRVAAYMREQQEHYFPQGSPLSQQQRAAMQSYFSSDLLDQVRIVPPNGSRVPNPPFYAEAKALGFGKFPEFGHLTSITFVDAVVFNERITPRALFHGLVHVAQFRLLGVDRYSSLLVRGFVATGWHITVPLEIHAFTLDSRFATNPATSFSVEQEVESWFREGRYNAHPDAD